MSIATASEFICKAYLDFNIGSIAEVALLKISCAYLSNFSVLDEVEGTRLATFRP